MSKKIKCVCQNCGKEFITTNYKRSYCSQECYLEKVKKRYEEHKKRREEEKKRLWYDTCLWCKEDMNPKTSNQRFCCYNCACAYRETLQKIYKSFPFQSERVRAEESKLRELGKNYKLSEALE